MYNRYMHVVRKARYSSDEHMHVHMHGYMHALASYVHMRNVACGVIARTCSILITNTFTDKERQSALRGVKQNVFFANA